MGLGKGKKKGGKLATMEKKEMPVETDPVKLVHFVCGSNIYTTGEDVKVCVYHLLHNNCSLHYFGLDRFISQK